MLDEGTQFEECPIEHTDDTIVVCYSTLLT